MTIAPGAPDDPVAAAMREAAARFVLPRFGNPQQHGVRHKPGGDLVTDADLEVEAFLVDRLSAIANIGVVAEERFDANGRAALASGSCWIVDPLDGTRPFVEGDDRFAMIVARVHDHEVVAAWLYFPARARLLTARRGQGAVEGARRLCVHPRATGGRMRLTQLLEPERTRARARLLAAGFVDDTPTCWELQRMLVGEPGGYLCTHVLPWDLAAGVLLVREAGGAVMRADGAPVRVTDEAGLYVFGPNIDTVAAWIRDHRLATSPPRSPLDFS